MVVIEGLQQGSIAFSCFVVRSGTTLIVSVLYSELLIRRQLNPELSTFIIICAMLLACETLRCASFLFGGLDPQIGKDRILVVTSW